MFVIKYPSIGLFRHAVAAIRSACHHHVQPEPVLHFKGTVKLHGQNAGVVIERASGASWTQSRETLLSAEETLNGFYLFEKTHPARKELLDTVSRLASDLPGSFICIYGEWCGENMKKGVALQQLPKMFVIFGVCTVEPSTSDEQHSERHWFTETQMLELAQALAPISRGSLYVINSFPQWSVTVDFANPVPALEQIERWTLEVERECPFAASFGKKGVGEGICWTCTTPWVVDPQRIRFKSKGPKHSDSSLKRKSEAVEPTNLDSIQAFASAVATEHRMEKMLDNITLAGHPLQPESLPFFLRAVGTDVLQEDSDVLSTSGLPKNQTMKAVNTIARNWFLTQCHAASAK